MPQIRYPVGGGSYDKVAGAVTESLNASGDTSACEFADWHVHTQVLNGMYIRKWVFENNPQVGTGGAMSGAPVVSYNYIDISFNLQVTEEKERASYCSGLYQPQQLAIYSDSDDGGLGLSGTFTTSAVGYARRKWVVGEDTEYNCQQSVNGVIDRQPGVYNTAFDTSASVGSQVADLLMQCESVCPRFSQSQVEY